MASVRQLLLQFLYLMLISLLSATALITSTSRTSLPSCPDKCGNVSIPYPFGTCPGCYRDGFDMTCNESFTPPKPFFRKGNIDLVDINITAVKARVLNYIGYRCYDKSGVVDEINPSIEINPSGAFLFSDRRNKFTVIGCDALAYIAGEGNTSYTSGCASFCKSLNDTTGNGGLCNGLGCCQTAIPKQLTYYKVNFGFSKSTAWSFNPCTYAALMQEDWYGFNVSDLMGRETFYERNEENAPIVLDWAIRKNGTCQKSNIEISTVPACLSKNSKCFNTSNGGGYICRCSQGYMGNPYLPNPYGCTDIDECKDPSRYPCKGTCNNTNGSYECSCPKGYRGDGKAGNCTKNPENFPLPARAAIASIPGVASLVGICFLSIWYKQHRRHVKEEQEYRKYYGMMHSHLWVFDKKKIEIATNYFDERYLIGSGGYGKVYKGLLEDNKAVAIKKSKEIDGNQKEEFIKEIILVSWINHKNIVKLYGCCLETQIPMLVYEFVPNGTLFDLLHGKGKEMRVPIPLSMRLNIALESADALDYLHSTITPSIIHGDVKAANILLDDEYHAKVSDFGASNLLSIDDAQFAEIVHWSRGYLDPECLCTLIITKKSDVYSFGVVILEIITRKTAIYIDNETGEKQNLASCFVSKYNPNELHNMLDEEIVTDDETVTEVLHKISELVVRCLSSRGDDRPTMKQVIEELQSIARLAGSLPSWQIDPKETDSLLKKSPVYSASGSAASPSTDYSTTMEIETIAR